MGAKDLARATMRPGVGRAAMLLALTQSGAEEQELGRSLENGGYHWCTTEVGGKAPDVRDRVTRAVIGAALNAGVVRKTPGEMHALLHAALEAVNGVLQDWNINASVALKVGIVRDARWLAVGMFGFSAFHPVTNHERAGLGVMHLPALSEAEENPETP